MTEGMLFSLIILLCVAVDFKFKVTYAKKDISEKIEITIRIRTDKIILILLWASILLSIGIWSFIDMVSIMGGILSVLLASYFTYCITIKTAFTSKGITSIDTFGNIRKTIIKWEIIERYEITNEYNEYKVLFYCKDIRNKTFHFTIDINKNQVHEVKSILGKYCK